MNAWKWIEFYGRLIRCGRHRINFPTVRRILFAHDLFACIFRGHVCNRLFFGRRTKVTRYCLASLNSTHLSPQTNDRDSTKSPNDKCIGVSVDCSVLPHFFGINILRFDRNRCIVCSACVRQIKQKQEKREEEKNSFLGVKCFPHVSLLSAIFQIGSRHHSMPSND